MDEAQRSLGTTLTKTSGTPLVITDLTSIGEVGVENSEIDVTTLDSTGGYKEFVPGFKDAGELALAGILKDEDSFQAMMDLVDGQVVHNFEIEYPSGAILFLRGYVKTWKKSEDTVEGVRGFSGSVRCTGPIVYAKTGVSI